MSSPEIVRVLMLSYGSGVGKSSLISKFLHNEFDEEYIPTSCGDILSKSMVVDGEPVILQILDTSGDPQLSQIAVESMKFADAFMVVYDTSVRSSLTSCLPLRFSILQEKQTMNPPMVLVGAKTDLKPETRKSSGHTLAESWECPYFETSSRNGVNVRAPFEQLIREHRARRRTFVHERKLSTFISNAFPRLRAWNSSDSTGRVLKSGWIHKRGLVRQNWKFRHVVIYDDGTLQYFNDEDDVRPLGELCLKDVWQIVDYREHGHEDAFVLQTPERDWYFSCLSSDEKNSWLDVVVRMIAHFASKSPVLDSTPSLSSATSVDVPASESDIFFEKRLSLSPAPSDSSAATSSSRGSTFLSPRMSHVSMAPIEEVISVAWT